MGNTNAKESRSGDAGGSSSHRHHRTSLAPAFDPSATSNDRPSSSHRTRNRASRNDLGTLLGIGATSSSSSRPDPSYERRETKQEREARRLERERIQRVKERERSIREEHVDGGYLVTMGVYVGAEDYSKQVVRQLQVRFPTPQCLPESMLPAEPLLTIVPCCRSRGNSHPSGEGSMILTTSGLNTKSLLLPEASLSPPPARHRQTN